MENMENMENMDNAQSVQNMQNMPVRRPNPRRRPPKKKKLNPKFLLTVGVVVALIVLFIIFAVGSVNRANEKREQARQESLAVESSIAQQRLEWEQEAQDLIRESEKYAAACEFDKAIEVLDRFSGDPNEFNNLIICREKYEKAESQLVLWEDVTQVPFLSFSKLLDPETGFSGSKGEDNRYYYISTTEFTAILTQLYANDYMLVDMDDLFTTTKNDDGTTLIVKNELRLPEGKKPIVLIHCQPEGYENKLVLDAEGNIVSQVTPEEGNSYTGAYDFVPLLEDFIAKNPGFSFQGARAVLAVTGYKGLFGYELTQTDSIISIVNALKEKGYTLASNTYGNARYGKMDILELQDDLAKWENEVKPLLGETEILAYARSSDISDGKEAYTSKKYEKLYMAGFRYYMGICYNSSPWMNITDNTIRMGRLMVTGSNLKDKPALFANLFDASAVYGEK